MNMKELIDNLDNTDKKLVYTAYKIWFNILYPEYDYNESLVEQFIYDIFENDIYLVTDKTKFTSTVTSVFRTIQSNGDVIFKFEYESNSKCTYLLQEKLNNIINEYK